MSGDMTDAPDTWLNRFYDGLKRLDDSTFPKTCTNCGRTFETPQDFIRETQSVNNQSGLTEYELPDNTFVGLFRNCPCNSTLMGTFKDRRDNSPRGVEMRDRFEVMLQLLESRGITRDNARTELLTVLKGGESKLLESLGIELNQH